MTKYKRGGIVLRLLGIDILYKNTLHIYIKQYKYILKLTFQLTVTINLQRYSTVSNKTKILDNNIAIKLLFIQRPVLNTAFIELSNNCETCK